MLFQLIGTLYQIAVPIYVALLLGMAWRASVQKKTPNDGKAIWLTRLGGVSFVISDGILGLTDITGIISRKVVTPQLSTILVLSTYYLAQYCLAKSALRFGSSTESTKKRITATENDDTQML